MLKRRRGSSESGAAAPTGDRRGDRGCAGTSQSLRPQPSRPLVQSSDREPKPARAHFRTPPLPASLAAHFLFSASPSTPAPHPTPRASSANCSTAPSAHRNRRSPSRLASRTACPDPTRRLEAAAGCSFPVFLCLHGAFLSFPRQQHPLQVLDAASVCTQLRHQRAMNPRRSVTRSPDPLLQIPPVVLPANSSHTPWPPARHTHPSRTLSTHQALANRARRTQVGRTPGPLRAPVPSPASPARARAHAAVHPRRVLHRASSPQRVCTRPQPAPRSLCPRTSS